MIQQWVHVILFGLDHTCQAASGCVEDWLTLRILAWTHATKQTSVRYDLHFGLCLVNLFNGRGPFMVLGLHGSCWIPAGWVANVSVAPVAQVRVVSCLCRRHSE